MFIVIVQIDILKSNVTFGNQIVKTNTKTYKFEFFKSTLSEKNMFPIYLYSVKSYPTPPLKIVPLTIDSRDSYTQFFWITVGVITRFIWKGLKSRIQKCIFEVIKSIHNEVKIKVSSKIRHDMITVVTWTHYIYLLHTFIASHASNTCHPLITFY